MAIGRRDRMSAAPSDHSPAANVDGAEVAEDEVVDIRMVPTSSVMDIPQRYPPHRPSHCGPRQRSTLTKSTTSPRQTLRAARIGMDTDRSL
jgi:hypothetical protein